MALQRAVILTHWVGSGTSSDPFTFPAAITVLAKARDITDKVGLDITANDALLVLVEDDESAIPDNATHRVLYRSYVGGGRSALEPDENMTAGEVTALAAWLTAKFGVTNTQIAAWFDSTPAQLANWLRNHSRAEAVQKLVTAYRRKVWK